MTLVRRLLLVVGTVSALAALPAIASAQEATITGKIVDSTGGVLPGVTVTALHEATGTQFVGVTDTLGVYRIPVRIGDFRISAELPGFATITRTGVTLLVGQTATLDLQMAPSTVQESVTVTGEAPLVDMAAKGMLRPTSVRRVAVVGPGLDFTDKQEGYDFYPLQTIQPFAVIDSLRARRLAAANDLRMTERFVNRVHRLSGRC